MSWFEPIRKFFGNLFRRKDNRTRPSPGDKLMPSAEREELLGWQKEMKENARNRMSLRQMKKLKQKDKMLMMKNLIEGQTHEDDKIETESGILEIERGMETPEANVSDMVSSDESENHSQSEDSEIREDDYKKEGFEKCNDDDDDDTDSDDSSKLDGSESSQEDVKKKSKGSPEQPILDKDEDTETDEDTEDVDKNASQEDEEEERARGQGCEDQLSIHSEDSESVVDSDARNNNLFEGWKCQDSESGIDWKAQNNNVCEILGLEKKVRGRRRVSDESILRKQPEEGQELGGGLSVYYAKIVGSYDYDITPTRSYEIVGHTESTGISKMSPRGSESPEKKVRGRRQVSEESVIRSQLRRGQGQGGVQWVYNAESVKTYDYDITPTRSYERVGHPEFLQSTRTPEMSLGGTESPEEKPSKTENWDKHLDVWNSTSGSCSEFEDKESEKVESIREGEYSKITDPDEKSLSSEVNVTSSDEDKTALKDDQPSTEKKPEVEIRELLLKLAPRYTAVEKLVDRAEQRSSTNGFLRKGLRWVGSKIKPNKKSNESIGFGFAESESVEPKPKKGPGRRFMKSSKDDIVPRDKSRKKMSSYLKESWTDGNEESLSYIYGGPGGVSRQFGGSWTPE